MPQKYYLLHTLAVAILALYAGSYCSKEGFLSAAEHSHPIDVLVENAEQEFRRMLATQTTSHEQAVLAYRQRRGFDPPRGFEAWLDLAASYDSVMAEQLWDPIYEDLGPFWHRAAGVRAVVQNLTEHSGQDDIEAYWVTRGEVGTGCDDGEFCGDFLAMFREAVGDLERAGGRGHLCDLRIALNGFVSPRVWVTWEEMHSKNRNKTDEVEWHTVGEDEYPTMVRESCRPDSRARMTPPQGNRVGDAQLDSLAGTAPHTLGGFVHDFARSKSPCHQPDLISLHGSLFSPAYRRVTRGLLPIFSVQKVADVTPEIRIPSPLHWTEPRTYHASSPPGPAEEDSWADKVAKAIWRGGNTGGQVTAKNWQRFPRHRLVAMTNSSELETYEEHTGRPPHWAIPAGMYPPAAELLPWHWHGRPLSSFFREKVDTGFYAFGCQDSPGGLLGEAGCPYLQRAYHVVGPKRLRDIQRYKYLIDVDGNGYSARFRSFLLSTSVPVKATIFSEWYDSRLVPWKHFVPMDNRFGDLAGILAYFMQPGHDGAARKIGLGGAAWARRTLRKEDMKLYIARLLLEYARVYCGDPPRPL